MAEGAMIVSWGAIIPGREQAAAAVLHRAMALLEHEREGGRIASYEAVLLDPNGADFEGFVLVRGEAVALAELARDARFEETIIAVRLVHQGVAVRTARIGAELARHLAVWSRVEADLLG